MFCKYCGNQIDDDPVFCSSCGKKVAGASTQGMAQATTENIAQNTATQSTSHRTREYNAYTTTQFFDAVKKADADKVRQLVSQGVSVNVIDENGNTPLMYAAPGIAEIVRILLEAGADIHIKNNYNKTAFSLAELNSTDDKYEILALLKWYSMKGAQHSQSSTTTSVSEHGKINTTVNINMASTVRAANPNASPKSRTVCLLLAIFLGGVGEHRFYAGKIGTAILKIVLWFFCLFPSAVYIVGIGAFVWWLVDLIMVACGKFTDKDDKLISVWE